MNLIEIQIENFRQFYGLQKIEFAKGNKNITVILGENGRGKTGIFRAMVFCLFGLEYLEQDIEYDVKGEIKKPNKIDKIHLVNLNKLQENINKAVTSIVEVKFEHNNRNYLIKRSIKQIKLSNGDIEKENENEVECRIVDENGNVSPDIIKNDDDLQIILSEILSKEIKDFFFFDAEKIEKLARVNTMTRIEIKKGILRLLQIDKLNKGLEIIQKIKRDQEIRLRKQSSNTKLENANNNKDRLINELSKIESKLDNKKEEMSKLTDELKDCKEELSKNEEIKKLFDEQGHIKNTITEKEKFLKLLKTNVAKNVRDNSNIMILEDYYIRANNFIAQEMNENKYSLGITIDLLKEILESKICLCERKFNENDDAYIALKNLQMKFNKSEMHDFISSMNRNLSNFLDNKKDLLSDTKLMLQQIAEHKEEIEDLNKKFDKFSERTKEYARNQEYLVEKEKQFSKLDKDHREINNEIAVINNDLIRKKEELKKINEEIDILEREDQKLKSEKSRLDFIVEIENALLEILEKYSSIMRNKLSDESTSIFHKLISPDDKNLFNKIKINEHYEIEVEGWNIGSFLQDISSGQKELVSLSFVTALAKVAAGEEQEIHMPLFMDSPFGRISGDNRDRLINLIPNLTAQWILLVTDTEFTTEEVRQMRNTNKWDKLYILKQLKEGHSQLEEIKNIDEFVSGR